MIRIVGLTHWIWNIFKKSTIKSNILGKLLNKDFLNSHKISVYQGEKKTFANLLYKLNLSIKLKNDTPFINQLKNTNKFAVQFEKIDPEFIIF